MTREELKEKISEISNSEFPLIDFFNDIGWFEGSKWFNTEKAYEDIEKIYNVFVYYKDKVKKLEKENQELKARYKKRAELCNEFCEYIKQYEKALDILKEVASLNCDKTLETERNLLRLSKEEYELLKEVFEDE